MRIGTKGKPYDYSNMDWMTKIIHKRIERFLNSCIEEKKPLALAPYTRIDSLRIDNHRKEINIYLNDNFAYIPFRDNTFKKINYYTKRYLGRRYRYYSINMFSSLWPVEELVPNYYRKNLKSYDLKRMPVNDIRSKPIVQNISKSWKPSQGLYTRNIALWHSHGWYFEKSLNRWEWQRARLFQTVEDIGPMAFTIPYLIPMLENAGANVFVPRERDIQTNEVIVDNDSLGDMFGQYKESFKDRENHWHKGLSSGFAIGMPPYTTNVNLFKLGTYRIAKSDTVVSAKIEWIPNIPEDGDYGVYISYVSLDSSITDADYTVYHTGGQTQFLVNQQIGGGTWIYLGRFKFKSGKNEENGKVILTNTSRQRNKYITADAVRFGGGMGNIARDGTVSGRPRFLEGARYYLQYSGMPDSLVYNFNNDTADYKDDYQSRGEWVNYLKGAPYGPNKDRNAKGLGIAIDLSLAFHTDAGITKNDTTIGTLMIYSTLDADSTFNFPDGMSRLANRDFADIMQTQIIEDIRYKYDPIWNRRYLWDKQYSESFRPNVPSALLELLSHQNLLDMKFFHDPRFRFDVSRAIYKSMLKFIATQYQYEYRVQPLPVSHFQCSFLDLNTVLLRWKATSDPLEKTAEAEKYILYTRIEDNGFDNGILMKKPEAIIENILPGIIYSYKVSAVNEGGESFPSEILSVCSINNGRVPVLIINGFDRVSGPESVETEKFAGFVNFLDQGVPDRYDLDFTGDQFNFNPNSKWRDDDAPGFGASYGDYETRILPGNTFDFPYQHGKSLRALGYPFVSVSDEVVSERLINIKQYSYIDIVLGEEKQTDLPKPNGYKQFKTFPKQFQDVISDYCKSGGNIFISGAYVGSDLFDTNITDSLDINFAKNVLKYSWRTNHAAHDGSILVVDSTFKQCLSQFEFNTSYHPDIYTVEAADGIEPVDHLSKTILRYSENNISAAIAYQGQYNVVIFGFPFESILKQTIRDTVMQAIFSYFNVGANYKKY